MINRALTDTLSPTLAGSPSPLRACGYWTASRTVCAAAFSLVFALACGDDNLPPGQDAAAPNTRLRILDTGDDLGLSYNERMTLRVRYLNDLGERLAGESVEFSLVATGIEEDTVGSTLSVAVATTDDDGVAAVDLVAGAENASFRVSVDARDAPTQFYYVEISNGGFAQVRITPIHDGWRAAESFSRVDVRLYRPSQVTCGVLDIDTPPVSFSPARALDGFGGTVEYQNVAAGQSQVVVAWALVGESTVRSAVGCVDIAPGQLPPGLVEFAIVMDDRPLLAENTPVRTHFDLFEVVTRARELGAERPWQALSCDAGHGQLLLDCTLDALVPDGQPDCRPEADTALSLAISARRGALDMNQCRPLSDGEGDPSLDVRLSDAIGTGALFPTGEELAALLATRADIAAGFDLVTELSTVADGEGSGEPRSLFTHALVSAIATRPDGAVFSTDILTSSRPVVVQSGVTSTWHGPLAELADHRFTLRYGQIAADAFTELGLLPLELDDRAASLGQLLSESVSVGAMSGCDALSALICTDIGQPAACLRSACEQGAQILDLRMSDWWRAMEFAGTDFEISGALTAVDDDGDRVIDSFVPAEPGSATPWSAAMTLTNGMSVDVIGQLVTEPEEGP